MSIISHLKRSNKVKNWYSFLPIIRWPRIIELRNGIKFYLNDKHHTDFFIILEVAEMNVYRLEAMGNPKVILDIGANIGAFSILAAKMYPDAKVIAVEPEKNNLIHLKENIALNGITNIEVRECAVSDSYGTAKLFLDKNNSGGHSLEGAGEYQEVRMVPLDEFGIVDAIKIDCEGGEYNILKQSISAPYVAVEFHNGGIELDGYNFIDTTRSTHFVRVFTKAI